MSHVFVWLLRFFTLAYVVGAFISDSFVGQVCSAVLVMYTLFRGRAEEMPVAVISMDDEPVYKPLKSAPPDGYVKIRRAPYGAKLHRRSLTGKMTMKATRGKKDVESVIDAFNENVQLQSFAECIVEHNLTHKDGTPLNFKNPADVRALDPRTGEEIETYIDEINNFEEDEDLGNSSKASD